MKHPRLAVTAIIAALLLSVPAHAARTAAGVNITSQASMTYVDPIFGPGAALSNTVVILVDELLDLTLASDDATDVAALSPDANRVLAFTLTNTGNGSETFALSVDASLGGDDFDPANLRIYLDNGDGVFDILADTLLVPGSNDPVLAPESSRRVFVVADMPAGLANGNLARARLHAEAMTVQATPGADAPVTVFAGQGTNGGYAMVGYSGAAASADRAFVVSTVIADLVKSSVVTDAGGGSNPVPGATITYTLTFTTTGAGSISGTTITDPIPAGTTYVANSLRLNGVAVSDGADGDAGRFTGTGIEVVPGTAGTVAVPSTNTVTFKVTIDN